MEWILEWQEYDLAGTVGEKTFITCIGVTVSAPNVPVVDVFGTGILHQHTYSAIKQVPASHPASSLIFVPFPTSSACLPNLVVKASEMAVLNE